MIDALPYPNMQAALQLRLPILRRGNPGWWFRLGSDTDSQLRLRKPMPIRQRPLSRRRQRAQIARIALAVALALMLAPPEGRPAVKFAQSGSGNAIAAAASLRFEMDACGSLARVGGGRSLVKESSSREAEPPDPEDDDDAWGFAWGMSDGATAFAEQWLLQHPQVAIVTDAIDRSCGDPELDPYSGDSAQFA